MATEEGFVVAIAPPTARIKTTRSSACKSCASRGSCHTAGGGNDMEVEAINTVGAKVGDRVVIKFDSASLLKVSFLLYIFPILCMLAGAVMGQLLAPAFGLDPTIVSVIFGIAFFILAFFIIRFKGDRMSKNDAYRPKVTRILKRPPGPRVS